MSTRRDFLAGSAVALVGALLPRAIAAATSAVAPRWPLPPAAARIPETVGRFGHARIDDYAWLRPKDWFAVLRDPSTLEAPIRAQIDAENAYTEAMLAPTQPLQAQLRARIEALNALRPPEADAPDAPAIDGAAPGQSVATPDGRHVFWLRPASEGAPATVLRRDVADGTDAVVYAESDPAFAVTLRPSALRNHVVLRSQGQRSSEVRLLATARPLDPPVLVEPRAPEHEYDVDEWNDDLVVRSNADGAFDFQLLTAPFDRPGRAHWRPLVPHVPGRVITGMHPFDGVLVREELRDALPRLVLMPRDGREQDVAFDEAAYALEVPAAQDGRGAHLDFSFESPRTPPVRRRLDLASGRHEALDPAPAFDPSRYEVRRLVVPAADGAQVPVTVLMRAGQALDGSVPLMQIAYGGYGLSIDARFDVAAVALVEQGWIHAIAHVRGGGERGAGWWLPTMRTGKKATHDDFIACAEHLADAGYGSRGRIVAFGLSAGGTLMGVVGNRRPELWAGLIAPVAFMDVLSTLERYDEHPLGGAGIPVWGDPADPVEHAFVESFSPCDNLPAAPLPAWFTTAVVDDDAVSFWEPVKFAIKARSLTTGGQPILSHTAPSGGHLSAWGAFPQPEQQAAYLAFAIWAVDRRWGEVPQRAPDADDGRG